MINFNVIDLTTCGFLVVKNFLDYTDIDRLLNDYQFRRKNADATVHLKEHTLSKSGPHRLEDKIIPLIDLISAETDIKIDLLGPNGMYFDTVSANLPWHQDHESYYTWQTGYHQVNFWIPLVKPDAKMSGLKVVPMDTLKLRIGSLFGQRILDQGAKRFIPDGDITHVIDDEQGDTFDLPVNIDTIAEILDMNPGDMLVTRGDVVHATQDCTTQRVALSIKAVDGNHYIQKQQFINQCEVKKNALNGNFYGIKKISDRFNAGEEQILIHDMYNGRIQKEK